MLRFSLLAVAFLAATNASPVNINKRDLIVVTDVITDVVVVTETAGAAPPIPTSSTPAQNGWSYQSSSIAPQPSAEPSTTSPAMMVASSSYMAPSPASASISGSDAQPSTFAGLVLDHHNAHRTNHSAPEIVWDQGLADTAAKIAASCYYAHNTAMDGGGYGQNIAAGAPASNISAVITDSFYNGEVNYFNGLYGEANPDMTEFEHWGHFSQIVWKATGSVGCAVQNCTSQGLGNVGADVAPFFTVCNYKGAGNVGGEYGDNIGDPLGYASINYDTFGLL